MSDIPLFNTHIDKDKAPAIHKKRMLAFINDFILTTSSFLNEFTANCESKIISLDEKIQKIENCLMIVESKLASVPSSETQSQQKVEPKLPDVPEQKTVEITTVQEPTTTTTTVEIVDPPMPVKEEAENSNLIKISEHRNYRKYFKMVQFGVAAEAVKLKMASEDVDPNILDTPNLLVERPPDEEFEEFV